MKMDNERKIPRTPEEMIGMRMFLRSNEDEPLFIGTLVEWTPIGNGYMAILEDDNGERCGAGGAIMFPYSNEIIGVLEKLSHKEQYDFLSQITLSLSIERHQRFQPLSKDIIKGLSKK